MPRGNLLCLCSHHHFLTLFALCPSPLLFPFVSLRVEICVVQWRAIGVTSDFIDMNPGGVAWGCEACELVAATIEGRTTLSQRCLTCDGYPAGYPECLGVAWEQTFRDLPAAMWFTIVTVTTVGYGDISPVSS